MEYTLRQKEELLDKLEQISESVAVIAERIKGIDSLDELMVTPCGE